MIDDQYDSAEQETVTEVLKVSEPEAPAEDTKKVITEADHEPYGKGGEYVLLPNGLRVSAALYEETQK